MFGLEDKGRKKDEPFYFDLEEEFLDAERKEEIKERIHDKLFKIKALLRKGEIQDDFEKLGHLVYGYAAFLKVMHRVNLNKTKK